MSVERSFYHVDPGEDITSIFRAVKAAIGQQVAVVLPPDPSMFRSDLNLRLLISYAKAGGKDVALVTQDAAVIHLATGLGIPVYATPQSTWRPEGQIVTAEITEPLPVVEAPVVAVSRSHARRQRRAAKRRQLHRVVLGLCAVVLAVAAGVAVWNLQQVTVIITPTLSVVEDTVTVPLQAADSAAGQGAGVRTATVSLPVTASAVVTASGRKSVGIAAASGTVIFFNETKKEVQVAKGTIVATDGGIRFATSSTIKVPPITVEYFMQVPVGTKAGQAEVAVVAVSSGSAGNVAAGRIHSLPKGPAGLKVTNPEATRNGIDQVRAVVNAADAANARIKAETALKERLQEQLAAKVDAAAYFLPEEIKLEQMQVKTTPAVGSEATEVIAQASAVCSGNYVLMSQLAVAAVNIAVAGLPAGMDLAGKPSSEQIVNVNPGSDALQVTVRFPAGKIIDSDVAPQLLAGKTIAQAKQALAEGGMDAEVVVEGGKNRLPRWKNWIKVIVAEPVLAEPSTKDIVE